MIERAACRLCQLVLLGLLISPCWARGAAAQQVVLLDQPSIRDNNVSIAQLIAQASAKTGENIQISRFVRFRMGEHAEA